MEVANMLEGANMTDKIKSFKDICYNLGLIMVVFFVSGGICTLLISFIHVRFSGAIGVTAEYILRLTLSGVFLYAIPIMAATLILKGENQTGIFALYKKPPRLAKALGNFPAVYGLGQLTNLIALLIVWLFSRFQASFVTTLQTSESALERSFGTMNSLLPPNILSGAVLFIYLVFAAAIFEEYLCRGILLNALKPYGNGFAIVVTAFLFGIMHGNFQQFSYAFVLGIVLGYITVQTGSILAATILHAMFNSVAAVMMLFLSTDTVRGRVFMQQSANENMLVLAAFGMFIALFLGLFVAGIALAVKKLLRIRAYKIDNGWTDISAKRKAAIFFTSIPVIIMLLLTIDAFAGRFVASQLFDVLWSA